VERLFYQLIYDKQFKRSMDILAILYKSNYDMTIKELGELLNISRKTVLSTVETVKKLLPSTLSLEVTEKSVKFCNSSKESIDGMIIEIARQTISYQVLMNAFYDKQLEIHELAEKLFVSESTLRVRIRHMNKVLSDFDCNLSFYNVSMNGSEANIRYFYYIYFSEFQELFISAHKNELKYCFTIYKNMKNRLVEKNAKLLNYSFQQATRLLLITKQRMSVGKFIQIDEMFIKKIQSSPFYQEFKIIYETENMEHFSDNSNISESECVWAYIAGLNNIIYSAHSNERILYREEPDCEDMKLKIEKILERSIEKLKIQSSDRKAFLTTHKAYLLNLSLLTKISPIFQTGELGIKKYIIDNLETLYIFWFECLSHLKEDELFELASVDSMAAQLAMISSPFIYNQRDQAKRILYSFEGEAGFVVYLESLAKILIPQGVDGVFYYNELITPKLLEDIQPDIVVCNYQMYEEIKGCRLLKMSYIPQIQEWTRLKELIVNINI
jgi:Transcriptional antiterminator